MITLLETTCFWLDINEEPSFSWTLLLVLIFLFPFTALFIAQAFKPSAHVWSNLLSPERPHLPCQEPPLTQQVCPAGLGIHTLHSEKQAKETHFHVGDDLKTKYKCWLSVHTFTIEWFSSFLKTNEGTEHKNNFVYS